MRIIDTDYLVVGSGIAGLMSAIRLGEKGRTLVLTKKESAESNTNYAQGGVACVMTSDDSFESHIDDTLVAGDGLCDREVVRAIVSAGPERIAELEAMGVDFAEKPGAGAPGYDLGREGGHSMRRVLHSGDITGAAIESALLARVRANPNIEIMEHCMVIDLITTGWLGLKEGNRCVGVYFLDKRSGGIAAIRAGHTILASGGGGKVYLYTSNPDIATGDGMAIAWRAGLRIKNMEFIQFHPTCLFHPRAKSFLISEAVRGEGAILVNEKGERFMERYDKRGELAPRDVVARAIDREMKISGAHCVYLDSRHKGKAFLSKRFPTIYKTCLQFGFDMARDPVPVVPAAHYFCGGVEAGIDGSTAMPCLWACGETACTGLHGANRLASNSLLEALVCAYNLAGKASSSPGSGRKVKIPDWHSGDAVPSDEAVVVAHNWNEVRSCMWDYVGIVRSNKRLERAKRRILNLMREIRDYYLHYHVTADVLELRNIAAVAGLIIRSAQQRRESRGLNYNIDFPGKSAEASDTIISDPPGGNPDAAEA